MDIIQCAYPATVDSIFNSNVDIKYSRMLVVNILLYRRTEYITLGSIFNSKAFINSNYYIIENIFLDQLQYNRETAFNN